METLGAAQFGTPGSVDRLRSFAAPDRLPGGAVVLAATDPANVYGAALPWPDRTAAADTDAVDDATSSLLMLAPICACSCESSCK